MHCWHNNKLYIVFCSFSGTFVVYSTYKFSLMRLPGKNALSAVSLSFGARTDSTGLRKRTHFAMKLPWRGFETRPDAARCYRTSFCRSCGKVWGSSSLLYFSASMRISEGGSGENIIAGIIWYVVKYDSHESEVEATCGEAWGFTSLFLGEAVVRGKWEYVYEATRKKIQILITWEWGEKCEAHP